MLVAGYAGARGKGAEVRKQAEMLLKEMGVWEVRMRLPSEISGGETQRTAVARAIISTPDIVWCDEPTGVLNKSNTIEVLNLLQRLNQNGQSIVMVTHDLRAAVRGIRILYLEDGKILDEMRLCPYRQEGEKAREQKINAWLSTLKW